MEENTFEQNFTPQSPNEPINLDARAVIARKIALLGISATILLSVGALVATFSGSADSSSSIFAESPAPVEDSSWVPIGYTLTDQDSNVAYKWVTQENDCDTYRCNWASFVSLSGCPSSFYAAVNELDATDNVIGYSNASLPSLQPMQYAKLRFDDTSDSAHSAQLSEIHCR